jgi:transcriptional regulator of acetoin/glycerol metabolism
MPCPKCERDAALLRSRKRKQDEYLSKLLDLDDKIEIQKRMARDVDDLDTQDATLKKKEKELKQATQYTAAKKAAHSQKTRTSTADITPKPRSKVSPDSKSDASKAWERQKQHSGDSNEHMDSIMAMIGLDSVKRSVLDVKDKVEISIRQGADLTKERYNALLLGNPGTGE